MAGLSCCGWRCGVEGSTRVGTSPLEDALKMVAAVWCSAWSPSARQVTRTQAQTTVGVRCWVHDASVKNMTWLSLGTGRRAIAVG